MRTPMQPTPDEHFLQRYLEAQALDYLMMYDDMDTSPHMPHVHYVNESTPSTTNPIHMLNESGAEPSVS